MISEEEPIIKRDDGTPPLSVQAEKEGWEFGFYDFGKAEEPGVDWFNPGLVQRPDGLWLLVRRSVRENLFGRNEVCAILLNDSGRIPKGGKKLEWLEAEADEQHEDARAVYVEGLNQVLVSACNFVWYGDGEGWTGATQVVGFFDSEWECKIKHRPPIEGNPPQLTKIDPSQYNKNWVPFFHGGQFHLIYKTDPWSIFRFGESWNDFDREFIRPGATWKWGTIRGGTPPVLVDGLYWTFHHSSLPWRGNYRRYYAGALALEPQWPFRPVLISETPILMGSQQDPWEQRKPVCVFPCGSVYRDGKFLITMGVNDLKSAWCEIPYESLRKKMVTLKDGDNKQIFPVNGLSDAEVKKAKLRANAAKARAAKAAKRAKVQ
jgi:predicted GH43/DUF377 family glycosyl hydrolase